MRSRRARVAKAKLAAPKALERVYRQIGDCRMATCGCSQQTFVLAIEIATNEALLMCRSCKTVFRVVAELLTTTKKVA